MDSPTPESEPQAPKAKPARNLPYLVLAGVCLVAGIAAGVVMNSPTNDASIENGASAPMSADDAALAAVQDRLLNTLVLPTDFKSVPDFSLLDVNGDAIDQTVFDGQWSIVFFGFTHCPDVCPITLTVMKDVVAQLDKSELETPQTLFVSVDPNRDTPEVLKNYMGYFDPRFIGITGDLNGVHQMSRSLGIVTAFTAREDNPKEYDVDHTASMLLIDPQRRLRAKFSAPHTSDAIVSDFTTLMSAIGNTRSASL